MGIDSNSMIILHKQTMTYMACIYMIIMTLSECYFVTKTKISFILRIYEKH